jgi:DNA-binding Lrp family transcriptional regulator
MDRGKFATFAALREKTGQSERDLKKRIDRLLQSGLLCPGRENDQDGYFQAD